jgi:LysM repeat protein
MNTMNLCLNSCQPSAKVNLFAQWMLKLTVAMLLIICVSMATAQNSSVYAQEAVYHTVRSGETLSSIASRYGVGVNTLASYNGISNPNLLRPGQVLRIPVASQPVPATPRPQSTPAPPPTSNPLPTVSSQPVAPVGYPTPTATPPASSTRYHIMRPNDTLYGIAAWYGASVDAIKRRNGLTSNTIYVGQSLAIP